MPGDSLTVDAALQYRKFDCQLHAAVPRARTSTYNDLPITTIATDRITFPVGQAGRVRDRCAGAGDSPKLAALERFRYRPVA